MFCGWLTCECRQEWRQWVLTWQSQEWMLVNFHFLTRSYEFTNTTLDIFFSKIFLYHMKRIWNFLIHVYSHHLIFFPTMNRKHYSFPESHRINLITECLNLRRNTQLVHSTGSWVNNMITLLSVLSCNSLSLKCTITCKSNVSHTQRPVRYMSCLERGLARTMVVNVVVAVGRGQVTSHQNQ